MVLKWRNPMRKTVEEHFAEICKRLDKIAIKDTDRKGLEKT